MLKEQFLFFFVLSFFTLNKQNKNLVSTWNISSAFFKLPLKDFMNNTIDWGDDIPTI
jgi:hypothetical protein